MKPLCYNNLLFSGKRAIQVIYSLFLLCIGPSLFAQEINDRDYTKNNAYVIDFDNSGDESTLLFGYKITSGTSRGTLYPTYDNSYGYVNVVYSNVRDWIPYVNKGQNSRDFFDMRLGYRLETGSSSSTSDSRTYSSHDLMTLLRNGNVGIGTTTPNAALQLANSVANRKIVLWETANNDHNYYGLGINGGMFRYQIDAVNATHAFFAGANSTTSNELMRIQGNGNVGIGTTTPAQKLDVNGTIQATGFKLPTGAHAGYVLTSAGEDGVAGWAAASTTSTSSTGWTLNGSYTNTTNNVGIGTDSPHAKLDIVSGADSDGGNDAYAIALQYRSGGYRHWIRSRHNSIIGNSGNAIDFYLNNSTTDAGSATSSVGTIHGMSITGVGVGIGATAPISRLQIGAKVVADNAFVVERDALSVIHQTPTSSTVLNDPKSTLLLMRQGTAGQAFGAGAAFNLSRYENNSINSRSRLDISLAHNYFDLNSNTVMTMLSNGKVGIGTTSPQATLDVRGRSVFYPNGDNGVGLTISKTSTGEGWIGTIAGTTTANKKGLFIGTDGGGQMFLDTADNVFVGFYGVTLPTITNAKSKFDLFVHQGVLSEDYGLAPISSWSDHVFEDNYPLEKLSDVESFIRKNKHLPNIPSQAEIAKEGYTVHEMNRKFLEKIEELTLHAIGQEKEITQLKQQLRGYENLAADIQALKAQLNKK